MCLDPSGRHGVSTDGSGLVEDRDLSHCRVLPKAWHELMSEAAQGSAKERADLVWDFWCKTSGAVISSRCAHRCAHCWERKHHHQKHKWIVISGLHSLSGAGKQERF